MAATAAALLLVLASSGCARLFAGYDRAPNGLLRTDWELRRVLVEGDADSTLLRPEAISDRLPDDELLRSLYQGVLAYYAGQPGLSAEWLAAAEALAEERYTKSLTRSALSLVASDLSLPYEPVEAERLLIHYFGALGWTLRGEPDEAAVEARRLSFLLDRYDEQDPDGGATLRPFLRSFAGAVFEAAGEWNDAAVAHRKAAAYGGAVPDSLADLDRRDDGLGEVIVLVERGFVAHQVEQGVLVALSGAQAERLSGGGADERAGLAAAIAARALLHFASGPAPADRWAASGRTAYIDLSEEDWDADDPRCGPAAADPWRSMQPDSAAGSGGGVRTASTERAGARAGREDGCVETGRRPKKDDEKSERDEDNPYILRLAWPAFRQDRPGPSPLRVLAEGTPGTRFAASADLSEAVSDGFQDRREWQLARMIVRASAKLALTRTVEKEVGDKDEVAGKVLGFLTNAGTALLEQADTRSLHLLPAGVTLARLRLAPGVHTLQIEVAGGAAGTRLVSLPPVEVRAGGVSFVTTRLWN